MARATPLKGNWLIKLIALAGMLELVYLVIANLLLNVPYIQMKLSSKPDQFTIQWSSGWTYLPGHLYVNNLQVEGRTPERQWSVLMSEGEFDLALWRLFSRTIQMQSSTMSGLTVTVNSTITEIPGAAESQNPAAPAGPPEALQPLEKINIPSSIEQKKTGAGWAFIIGHADIANIDQIKIDTYIFTGHGGVQLNELTFGTDGALALERGTLQIESGLLMSGSKSIGTSLESDIELRLERFVPAEQDGLTATGFISGSIDLSGDLSSFAILNRYLSDSGWLQLKGRGALTTHLLIEKGRLVEGSELSIESPDLAVELEEKNDSGSGDQYSIRGAGTVKGDVSSRSGDAKTQLQVELKDIVMHTEPQEQLLLKGKAFHLLLTGPPVYLSETSAEPVVRLQWDEAVMPDISLLNDYLPGEMPFRIHAGRARLNGYLNYTDRVVSGIFELAGEDVSGEILNESVIGRLGLELHLKQADINNRQLDLSGTRLELQTGHSDPGTADQTDQGALRTELKIIEGRLTSAIPLNELKGFQGRPPLSGILQLEGKIGNIDFLSDFLSDRTALEFGGDGVVRTNLRVHEGQLAPGSILEIESDKLFSSFSGFTASGSGNVLVELQKVAEVEEISLKMDLRDMKLHQVQDGRLLFQGKGLQLSASSPPVDIRNRHDLLKIEVKWQDALVPDLEIVNGYLPENPPFLSSSGSARTSGHIEFDNSSISGDIRLAGENVTGMLLKQPVSGKLDLDLLIKQLKPESRFLDISGTRILMQAGSTAGETKPLETRITIGEAKLKLSPDSLQEEKSGAPPPLSGVVRLEGSVANIGFVNSFLKNSQGLKIAGNGHLNADLRFLEGQMAPGSTLQITSDNLSSRFLDFEANGSGKVSARIEGEADAPVAKIESSIKSFRLRRLGETVSYVSGNGFQITTEARSFDSILGLQNLETSVRLMAAEIPDITVYNSYLPENAGISIDSGTGKVAGEFHLSGNSGSGNLDMMAEGVEVNVKGQVIRGDLHIYTHLADGNLEKMIFDASGTTLRIENGSLLSQNGTQAEDWWGQLDIKRGHMTWKRPLLLNAALNLQLSDSGLLVHLFVKEKKKWLTDLLTIKNVTGKTKVLLNGNSILLSKVRITGEQLLVLADVLLSEKKIRGGMYAKYGILRMGIELEDEDRTLRLMKPLKWYDSFSKDFETVAR
ncbi:hypothetical protein [Desulforhopalus sp. IMCC35007]|uniref:hypothetical protein n=1 Tax=Desulforhopalus sp. IMCC35007 TaxID=2569543 RepID=UPI0010AE2BB6|nr:hypothetical protein [Desulforhopalus sp. IMCC35007]TKB10398.1 hypothetical protein FCL48_07580 [Desulforhopalus sp. IMCC35007]